MEDCGGQGLKCELRRPDRRKNIIGHGTRGFNLACGNPGPHMREQRRTGHDSRTPDYWSALLDIYIYLYLHKYINSANSDIYISEFASCFFPLPPSSFPQFLLGVGSGGNMGQLEELVMAEQQKALVQSVIARLTEMAFENCVAKPASALSSSEQGCIKVRGEEGGSEGGKK